MTRLPAFLRAADPCVSVRSLVLSQPARCCEVYTTATRARPELSSAALLAVVDDAVARWKRLQRLQLLEPTLGKPLLGKLNAKPQLQHEWSTSVGALDRCEAVRKPRLALIGVAPSECVQLAHALCEGAVVQQLCILVDLINEVIVVRPIIAWAYVAQPKTLQGLK